MKIYKIAQNKLYLDSETLDDRIRIYLKNNNDIVGKLTLQFNLDDKRYILTYFQLEDQYQKQGWGTKMFEELLKLYDGGKPILVQPLPFLDDDVDQQIQSLKSFYLKLGFREYEKYPSWMIYGQDKNENI